MKKEDTYYKAMLARDHRFDGKFFVGVKTTGIYCRPICPAKPKKENVEFFPNHLAAEKAGYRPCMRCHPESAPESPLWIGKSAMVRRAVKLINEPNALSFDEDEFAERFGVSARHLRRVFMEEIGKTPKQLAFENRLNLSRKLLGETDLPISEIAFASGFESIRRFNSAFKDRFKKNPRDFRTKKEKGELLSVTLPYRPPYDFEALLKSYENHRVGNLERFHDGKMSRIISFDKKVGEITISHLPEEYSIKVEIDFPDASYIYQILSKVRALFDLDSDPVIIANALEIDPAMKKLLKKHQGIRLPSGWDPFEVAIGTILGQLVSVESGVKLVAQLIDILGVDSGLAHEGKKIKLFPTPEKIATADLTELKSTRMRKETLKRFAQAVVDKQVSLDSTQDLDEFYASLKTIKGIGPWTAHYMALKVIRHTDAFPETDLIIARALKSHKLEVINKMSPWRGYVAAILWREYWKVLQKPRKDK